MKKIVLAVLTAGVIVSGAFAETINIDSAFVKQADACLTTKVLPVDFGLSANKGFGVVDLNKQKYLDSAARASMKISDIDGDEIGLKQHIKCLLDNSSKIAEAEQKFKRDFPLMTMELLKKEYASAGVQLTDKDIKDKTSSASTTLLKEDCVFDNTRSGNEKVVCGELTFFFKGNVIQYNNRNIIDKEQRFGEKPIQSVSYIVKGN